MSLNKIYSKNIPGAAKVTFEPLWRLKRGFLSSKAVAELSSGAAKDSQPARTKHKPSPAPGKELQSQGWHRILDHSNCARQCFPSGRCTKCCVHQCGASALSAFSSDTQPIYWHRISLLSKLKLLKQTNANVILAVTGFLDMGHSKD